MSKQGRYMAWDFFKENKDEFQKRYRGFLVARLIKVGQFFYLGIKNNIRVISRQNSQTSEISYGHRHRFA